MATIIACGKAKVSDLIDESKKHKDIEEIAIDLVETEPTLSTGSEVDAFFESVTSDVENMKVVEQMRTMGFSEERIKSMVFNAVRCGDDGNNPSE